MCGIVGAIIKGSSGFYKKQEDTFFQMLYADQVRGEDSTGLIAVEKNTTFHIAKEACSAQEFIIKFKKTPINTAMWNSGKVFIGHNRKKTIGVVSDDTAHPFAVGEHFAMVHNGTLREWDKLAKNTKTDSEALAIHLEAAFKEGYEKHDVPKALEDALGRVDGAYAITCYDQRTNSVYLIRNLERPLSVVKVDDAWYWASEAPMAAWLLTRNDYKYDALEFHHLLPHELVTFDLDKNTMIKEQLSPKKSYTPPAKWVGSGTSTSTDITTVSDKLKVGSLCTDKDFKRFRKEQLGKRVVIEVDDFLENGYPNRKIEWGNAEYVELYGRTKALNSWHQCKFTINLKEFNFKTADDLMRKWTVTLESAVLRKGGWISVDCIDPKLVEKIEANKNDDPIEFRRSLGKMTYQELHIFVQALSEQGAKNWKINACNAEIHWRDSITTLEIATNRARAAGVILEQVKQDDMFIYRDRNGNIYYEAAIEVQ